MKKTAAGILLAGALVLGQVGAIASAFAAPESPDSNAAIFPKGAEESSAAIYLNDSWTGEANNAFGFATTQDAFVVGDWNGDGTDTIGARSQNWFHLRNTNADGALDHRFSYGRLGDQIFVGDWDGNGTDTLALRRGNTIFLQNSLAGGQADIAMDYGRVGDTILVGDWDGDGKDSFAVRRGATYFFRNTLSSGVSEDVIIYGREADDVITGDWDGDHRDTLAVRRGNHYFISNVIASGPADWEVYYGRASDEVLVGDWNADAKDTLGVVRRDGSIPQLLSAHNPRGVVDGVKPVGADAIAVSGWTFDADSTKPLKVQISVDSNPVMVLASISRPDVKNAFGLSFDTTGFERTLPVARGTHRVCVTAVNEGLGTNSLLGCSDVTVPETVNPVDPNKNFVAGDIISDAKMFSGPTMNAAQIQDFLTGKNPSCTPGQEACLKDYRKPTADMTAAYCQPYVGSADESAAEMIYKSATACGVNPQVLIVMLQKEQGLVTAKGAQLTTTKYDQALGFRCPNTGQCEGQYAGFSNQLYSAASRLVQYGEEPNRFSYRAGGTYQIAYNPAPSCGSSAVTMNNRATAALYNYTPFQPNAAALANMSGTGDSCSAYGNRNFWRTYTQWFGLTH